MNLSVTFDIISTIVDAIFEISAARCTSTSIETATVKGEMSAKIISELK